MKNVERDHNIDLGLTVLCVISPPGVTWTLRDLAEICGCSKAEIETIQRTALRKFMRVARAQYLQDFLQN